MLREEYQLPNFQNIITSKTILLEGDTEVHNRNKVRRFMNTV